MTNHLYDELLGQRARELRAIPGIGQQRALGIVRARWEAERAGQPFELEQVSGIGPAIAWQVSTWTAREGLRLEEAPADHDP